MCFTVHCIEFITTEIQEKEFEVHEPGGLNASSKVQILCQPWIIIMVMMMMMMIIIIKGVVL